VTTEASSPRSPNGNDVELDTESNYGPIPKRAQDVGMYGSFSAVRKILPKAEIKARDAWTIEANDLLWGPELGRGAFGIVYDGMWRRTRCAIKVMTEMTTEAHADFEKEASVMRELRPHENVIRLLGVCDEPFCLITEFVDNGSLDTWLEKNFSTTQPEVLFSILQGVARGVYHLHMEKIIHRDLAARNVLLTADLTAKVADFGQARDDTNDNMTKSDTGPVKWMAPECIMEKQYSVKSDTWAFGITAIEIYTGQTPYPDMTAMRAATAVASGKLTHPIPSNMSAELAAVVSQCFAFNPDHRPDMGEVTDKLDA
jgi:serine/threonine protein kinase